MKLKLVLQRELSISMLKSVNKIVQRLSHDNAWHLWQSIRHFEEFFDDQFIDSDFVATYDSKMNTIDFTDCDGTVVFYVEENNL